jgi:hypothetical protein
MGNEETTQPRAVGVGAEFRSDPSLRLEGIVSPQVRLPEFPTPNRTLWPNFTGPDCQIVYWARCWLGLDKCERRSIARRFERDPQRVSDRPGEPPLHQRGFPAEVFLKRRASGTEHVVVLLGAPNPAVQLREQRAELCCECLGELRATIEAR